jgi:type IV pilus assembly protein PilC
MLTATFIGYDKEGKKVCGSKKVKSMEVMVDFIVQNDITNFSTFTSQTKFDLRQYSVVSAKELSIFCKQMSVLFFSNISLMEGVSLLKDQCENKNLKIALEEIILRMEEGITFATAMAMYKHIFGVYLTNIINISENTGTMDISFERMAEYFVKEDITHKKIRSAIAYPILLATLITGIVLILLVRVLPMFKGMIISMGGEIPFFTNLIFTTSSFIGSYLILILFLLVCSIIAFMYYISKEEGRLWFDKIKLTVPVSKYIYARVITARVAMNLSILLKSGVQLVNALENVTLIIDNKYIENKFKIAIEKVKYGEKLEDALKGVNIFPPLFLKMVIVGEKTGKLDEMLEKSANYFDSEVDDAIEKTTNMVEPILIIILSIAVGFILIAIMLPMIEIMSVIGI